MEATRRIDTLLPEASDVSEVRSVDEIARLAREAEIAAREPYSFADPLEGDALSGSARKRSEYPCAFEAIAFVEGQRVLTITWLPPAV